MFCTVVVTAWFTWIKNIAKDCLPSLKNPSWIYRCMSTLSGILDKVVKALGKFVTKLINWAKKNVPLLEKLWNKIEDTLKKISNVCLFF